MRYYVDIAYQLRLDDLKFYTDSGLTKPATLSTDGTAAKGHYFIVQGNGTGWKVKCFTSLYVKALANGFIDVFLVGGGGAGGNLVDMQRFGSGGGGGRTKSYEMAAIKKGTVYPIVIGAGGASQGNGGTTSGFGFSVTGGTSGVTRGGNGGSGGSGGGVASSGTPGKDGGNGGSGSGEYSTGGGTGQGFSTKAFYELDHDTAAELYSTGGNGGGAFTPGRKGDPNTGNGGGGGAANNINGTNGGSGILIFRLARKEAAQ